MSKPLFGIAIAALLGAARPAMAQDVSVSLRLGDGPVSVQGFYASRPQYAIPRGLVCESDGPFLYCWDRAAYRVEHPVVYVYPADRRFVVLRRHYRHDRDDKYWRHAARRAFHRWHHGNPHRDGDMVVVLAWER